MPFVRTLVQAAQPFQQPTLTHLVEHRDGRCPLSQYDLLDNASSLFDESQDSQVQFVDSGTQCREIIQWLFRYDAECSSQSHVEFHRRDFFMIRARIHRTSITDMTIMIASAEVPARTAHLHEYLGV